MSTKKHTSYGFRFHESSQNNTANLLSVGWDEQVSMEYSWDGMKRNDIGTFVFQYTLSGRGEIEVDGKLFPLNPGDAFLVGIPSRHRYYLPKDSERWEFIYLSLTGNEVAACWQFMKEQTGAVIHVPIHEKLIQLLLAIYEETSEERITDHFLASSRAYEFVMECYRFGKNLYKRQEVLPNSIADSLLFIQKHFHEPITVEEMAQHAGLSKYYFIKQFKKYMRITPIQYLTNIRLKKAVELLSRSELTIQAIARQVGYEDANYFNKVFRKAIGTSAGQFRTSNTTLPIHHLILE